MKKFNLFLSTIFVTLAFVFVPFGFNNAYAEVKYEFAEVKAPFHEMEASNLMLTADIDAKATNYLMRGKLLKLTNAVVMDVDNNLNPKFVLLDCVGFVPENIMGIVAYTDKKNLEMYDRLKMFGRNDRVTVYVQVRQVVPSVGIECDILKIEKQY